MKLTVDADLLIPILQCTRTFEPAFLKTKHEKRKERKINYMSGARLRV